MSIIASIFYSISVGHGNGKHLASLSPEDAMQAIKWNMLSRPFCIMASCLPRIAVVLLLIRLMTLSKASKFFLLFITTSQTASAIASTTILFMQCKPVTALWDTKISVTSSYWDPSIQIDLSYFVGG